METLNIKHSSKSAEFYTPPNIVEAARVLMGRIDLDPASCSDANRIVQSGWYYDSAEDGLKQPWRGTVLLNPPGGKRGKESLPKLFWQKLVDEYTTGNVSDAVYIGFSVEQLQTTQSCSKSMMTFPLCIPSQRIRFWYVDPDGSLKESKAPTHSNVIVYLGEQVDRFIDIFSSFGQCKK